MRTITVLAFCLSPLLGIAAPAVAVSRLRDQVLVTRLTEDGKAACLIAVPEGAEYLALGQGLAARLGERVGAAPRVAVASTLPEADVKATHVIALGVFATNPIVEKLYHRLYVSCDWSWPKGLGSFVIRTVHDPWLTGRNVVCLGSVTSEGLAAACDRFVDLVPAERGGAVPPLIVVEQDPPIAAPSAEEVTKVLERIEKEGSSRSMGGIVSSHANRYFTTGHAEWASLFLAGMRRLDALHAAEGDASDTRSCRYLFQEFDRIEEGPAFSESERLELVNLFLRFATRMTYAKRTVKPSTHPRGNNWNAIAASYAGLYFSRYYPELGIGQKIVKTLETYYEPNMTNWKVEEDCPGYGDITLTGNYDWALARPDSRFVELGCLRRMADYDMLISDNAGRCSGFGDASGLGGAYLVNAYSLAAWLHKDGRYLWWYDRHGGKPNRYWVPPEVLVRKRPDDLLGVCVAPLAQWLYDRRNYARERTFPIEECYDKASFRSGFDGADQYLCMSGVGYGFHSHADANAIIRYADRGGVRLYDDGYMIPSLSEHNTVTVLRDGWAGKTPELSRILGRAESETTGVFCSRLPDYNGLHWDRNIIWRKGGYFLIIDDLECVDPGQYSVQCIWRTMGSARLTGRLWTSTTETGCMRLQAASDAVLAERESAGTSLNAKPFAMQQARALVQAKSRDMSSGDHYRFVNLLYSAGLEEAGPGPRIVRQPCDGLCVLDEGSGPVLAGVGESAPFAEFACAARTFHLSTTEAVLAGATHVQLFAASLTASAPVGLCLDVGTGKVQLTAQVPTEVRTSGPDGETSVALDAGEHRLQLHALTGEEKERLAAGLSRLSRAGEKGSEPPASPAPGGMLRMRKLWEYTDFRAFSDLGAAEGATISADRAPLPAGEVGHGTGNAGDLLKSGANIMFPAGEVVQFDIRLPAPRPLAQVTIKSRQLLTFRGGCGVRELTVWVSRDGFREDTRLLGRLANDKPLENNVVPYALRPDAMMDGQFIRVRAVPYSDAHKVYLDSIRVEGLAGKEDIAQSGFRLNGLAVADMDGDGRDEVVTGGTDRAVHAIRPDGERLWMLDTGSTVNALAVLDCTGQGEYAVAAGCDDKTLYVANEDGGERFTVTPPPRTYARAGYRGVKPFQSRLTVVYSADIQQDGTPEIVVGSANWRTYVYTPDGQLLWDEVCWAHTPTCGTACDLDGDGAQEVVMGNSYTRAVVYSADGKVIGSGGGSGHAGPTAVACADLDGNGKGEIVVGDRAGVIWFQEWKGRTLPSHSTGSDITALAVADLDGDRRLEVLASSRNYTLYTFDADGRPLRQTSLLTVADDLAVADVVGDGLPEVLCACQDGQVRVLRPDGECIAWFRGAGGMRRVAVCELDGNAATRELVAACDDGTVYALQVTGE